MSKRQKKEPPKCPVCMDHFTTVIRQPITCPFCPHATCRQCTSQYLLTTLNDPHCMGCRREWNREFIDTKLTQTFRKGPLRQHRRRVLIDRERGRLPAMQIFVEAQYEYNEALKVYHESRSRRILLKRQRNQIQAEYAPSDTLEQLTARLRPINQERLELKTRMRAAEEKMRQANATLTGRERPAEVRQFIMKCPSENCRGFLSSAWKCGTCQKFFCADCHAEKSGQRDEAHTCNEEAKATASMIRQETKPCPKCGIRISKIDGCFAKDTPILLWNGHYKNAQDIKVGDVLIGDDGEPRVVEELCSGGDEMYEVSQGKGISYTVNSKHKLALKFSGEKSIHWSESEQAWNVRWFDRTEYIMKSKKSRVNDTITKEDAYLCLKSFVDSLDFHETIEITVDDYMKLPESIKKHMMGFKGPGVHWPEKEVSLEPYLLGLWLGDGINDGMSFAINPEADPEILTYLLKWCEENQAELVHDEAYRFRIRRREVAKGRLAIGRGATSAECKGCKEKKCSPCDLPEKPYIDEVEVVLRHPLKECLDKYDLPRKSKYIPLEYLTSSREARLQLLAGLIDTDGYVGNGGKRIQIPQANHTLGKQIEYLARSLGFVVNIDILKKQNISFPNYTKKEYANQYRVNISGEHLSEIPTRVARKRCVDSNSTKDQLRTGIQVKSVGQGTYYGWSVSGTNKRFLLGDFTVARNCDQMWCVSCQTTFSWNSGQILLNTVVHNPHYYEYLRSRNGGVVPREAGDVPCGGLPNAYTFTRLIMDIPRQHLADAEKTEMMDIVRCLSDIQYVRLPAFPLRQAANVNQGLDIKFLMKELTEEEWGTALERVETTFERKKEIGLILQTLLHVGSEKLTQLQNARRDERNTIAKPHLDELKKVRAYTNKCLIEKGIQMGIVVPHITREWRWSWMRKGDMKNRIDETDITAPHVAQEIQQIVPEPVQLPPPVVEQETPDSENEEELPHEEMIMVEIGGEIIEMTVAQAQQILT